MREWLLVVAPLGFVLYFLVFPEQLGPAVDWVKSATQVVLASL
jgi:hypothetical protein